MFVGLLNSEKQFEFPKPYLKPEDYITCEQAIGDLPSLEHTLGDDVSEYDKEPQTEYQKLMRGISHSPVCYTKLVPSDCPWGIQARSLL